MKANLLEHGLTLIRQHDDNEHHVFSVMIIVVMINLAKICFLSQACNSLPGIPLMEKANHHLSNWNDIKLRKYTITNIMQKQVVVLFHWK